MTGDAQFQMERILQSPTMLCDSFLFFSFFFHFISDIQPCYRLTLEKLFKSSETDKDGFIWLEAPCI